MKKIYNLSICFMLCLTTLNFTGCDKADKKVETNTETKTETRTEPTATSTTVATTTPATPTPTATASTDTATAAATVDQLMSMMGSGMLMANKMTQQAKGQPQFSNEQIDCMANKGNDAATQEMQKFLQQNFSDAQMQEMNHYFASNTGKKQSEMTKNMMAAIVKDQKDIPKVQMTAEENKEMEAFWKSPTGTKLGTLLKDKEKLRPMMEKIVNKKQVDCNLPKGKA